MHVSAVHMTVHAESTLLTQGCTLVAAGSVLRQPQTDRLGKITIHDDANIIISFDLSIQVRKLKMCAFERSLF